MYEEVVYTIRHGAYAPFVRTVGLSERTSDEAVTLIDDIVLQILLVGVILAQSVLLVSCSGEKVVALRLLLDKALRVRVSLEELDR